MEDEDNKSLFKVGSLEIRGWMALVPMIMAFALMIMGVVHIFEGAR